MYKDKDHEEDAKDSVINLRELQHFNCNPEPKINLVVAFFFHRELFFMVNFKVESFLAYDDEIVNWASK